MLIDIIVVIVLVLGTMTGYRKGTVAIAFSMISKLVAVVLTLLFYPAFAAMFNALPVITKLKEWFVEYFASKLYEVANSGESSFSDVMNVITKEGNDAVSGTVNAAAQGFADSVFNIIAFIVLLIILFIIAKIVGGVLNSITSLPGLNIINKGVGSVFGLLVAWLIICGVFAFIVMLAPSDMLMSFSEAVGKSTVAKYIMINNPIMAFR